MDVDGAADSARLREETRRILKGSAFEERELHMVLVRFTCTDASVVGPDWGSLTCRFHPISILQ